MKKSPLKRKGKTDVALCKERIQKLLREIVIIRDGGCVLRNYPESGQCGGFRNDGELILQAEHLNTRERNISYGDTRNIVCLCMRHHFYFKKQFSRLYWDLIRKVIGEKRWKWYLRIEADNKVYRMGIYDWGKVELGLIQELNKIKTKICK